MGLGPFYCSVFDFSTSFQVALEIRIDAVGSPRRARGFPLKRLSFSMHEPRSTPLLYVQR